MVEHVELVPLFDVKHDLLEGDTAIPLQTLVLGGIPVEVLHSASVAEWMPNVISKVAGALRLGATATAQPTARPPTTPAGLTPSAR
jgi:hypothetical protein